MRGQKELHVVLQQTVREVLLAGETEPAHLETCNIMSEGSQRDEPQPGGCWRRSEVTMTPGAASDVGVLLLLQAAGGDQNDIKKERLSRVFLQQTFVDPL